MRSSDDLATKLGAPSSTLSADEPNAAQAQARAFARHCAKFRGADTRRAVIQIITTALPFLALLIAMGWLAETAYWAVLLLAIPAGGLLVRFFIIQHDCGHGSFLRGRRANDVLGRVMSVITLTPYSLWWRQHAIHHSGSGNLEQRGIGDIETWTVDEYRAAAPLARLRYRIYRHPLFLFAIGVPAYFLLVLRSPWGHGLPAREAWKSTLGLNVVVLAIYGTAAWVVGPVLLAKVWLPIVFVSAAAGGWLFFIQHQFEATLWEQPEDWEFQQAAVFGSSYYVLPKVLQWFTGNIGLHHIHHLNSMIPNYRLQECMDALPALSRVNRLTIAESLACVRLTLWDPKKRRLIGFSDLPAMA